MKLLALLASFLCCIGCGNFSGGGSTNIPPIGIVTGQPILLQLELTATGRQYGLLDTRYTNVQCHYEVADGSETVVATGHLDEVTNKSMRVVFVLPSVDLNDGEKLTYWFTFDFDGVRNKRDGGKLTTVIKDVDSTRTF